MDSLSLSAPSHLFLFRLPGKSYPRLQGAPFQFRRSFSGSSVWASRDDHLAVPLSSRKCRARNPFGRLNTPPPLHRIVLRHPRSGIEGEGNPAMGFLNLEDQFSFYLAYHSNKINTAIHVLFVWPLLYSALVFCAYSSTFIPALASLKSIPGHELIVFNLGFFVAAIYATYYISLDKKAGFLGAALAIGCWLGANFTFQQLGPALAWKVALATQLIGWISQFIGHGAFEGRAPALLDNLSQALLMAPFFVLLEVLAYLVNYEPSPGFAKRVYKKAASNIREFRSRKQKAA